MRTVFAILVSLVLMTAAYADIINVPGDYPTIEAAVEAALPFDTVMVAPGTYSVVHMTEKTDLTLLGSGMFGENRTTIANSSSDGIYIHNSSNIVIRGFEITNVHRGIHFYLGSSDCEVSDTYVHDNNLYYSDGISVNSCDNIYIHHNVYAYNYYSGIVVNNGSNIRIVNNTVVYSVGLTWGPNGILFNGFCPGLDIINNIIAFNADDGVESTAFQSGAIVSYNDNFGNGGDPWINFPLGTGNIAADPAFMSIAGVPYLLSGNSPCIDTGDPEILDPDNSVSDIGALWSGYISGGEGELTIGLSPVNPPIMIPPTGGELFFDVNITCVNDYRVFDGWYDLILPDGQIISPMLLRSAIYLPEGGSINRELSITIPALAMPGEYEVIAYVGEYPDSIDSEDSFTFEKDGFYNNQTGKSFADWHISGWGETEYFDVPVELPEEYSANLEASPNPFNPETTLRYNLPESGNIRISAYDVLGRETAVLFEGFSSSGEHELNWNAVDLSSGIYFVHLQTENNNTIKRVLLIK